MSRLLKVDQSKKAKEQYHHQIVDILLERSTKQEITEVLHCSERKARDIIAECSMHYPVISHSGQPGYRRAKVIDDLTLEELEKEMADVRRALHEAHSRVKCLKKRMKPLVAWLKVAEKKKEKLECTK